MLNSLSNVDKNVGEMSKTCWYNVDKCHQNIDEISLKYHLNVERMSVKYRRNVIETNEILVKCGCIIDQVSMDWRRNVDEISILYCHQKLEMRKLDRSLTFPCLSSCVTCAQLLVDSFYITWSFQLNFTIPTKNKENLIDFTSITHYLHDERLSLDPSLHFCWIHGLLFFFIFISSSLFSSYSKWIWT